MRIMWKTSLIAYFLHINWFTVADCAGASQLALMGDGKMPWRISRGPIAYALAGRLL